jgi:hypothetical protein
VLLEFLKRPLEMEIPMPRSCRWNLPGSEPNLPGSFEKSGTILWKVFPCKCAAVVTRSKSWWTFNRAA